MKISCAIVCHPDRHREYTHLAEQLKKQGLTPLLVIDHERSRHHLRQYLKAWKLFDPAADAHLCLEDDVTLCEDFVETLTRAWIQVARHGLHMNVMNLMLHTPKLKGVYDRGIRWVIQSNNIWDQGLMMLTGSVMDYIQWCESYVNFETCRDGCDALSEWVRQTHRIFLMPVPTLVEHSELKSMMGHANFNKPRKSGLFMGNVAHPSTIDFSAPGMQDLTAWPASHFKYCTEK